MGRVIGWVALGLLAFVCVYERGVPQDQPAEPTFEKDIAPIISRNCVKCHSPQGEHPDFDLTRFTDEASVLKKPGAWEKVWRQVVYGQMPPADAKRQPSNQAREKLAGYIEHAFGQLTNGEPDPGRVVIRRLNKAEFRNTIRDLIGVDVDVEDFPSDDVGYGFDNIGDVLGLPPLLFEKYLNATQKVLDKAVLLNVAREPPRVRIAGREFQAPKESRTKKDTRQIAYGREMTTEVHLPDGGTFTLKIRAGADRVGGVRPDLLFKVDGKDAVSFTVKASKNRPDEYETEVKLKKGKHALSIGWKAEKRGRELTGTGKYLAVEWMTLIGPTDAPPPKIPETHKRIFVADPKSRKEWPSAARTILEAFALRAFRRPPEKGDVDRLVKVFDGRVKAGEGFESAVRTALIVALLSPRFLFRMETDRKGDESKGTRPLDDWELASRLSYFVWSSMPDAELFELAAKGELSKNLEAQVQRMLKDPKSFALAENFAGQWLQIRRLEEVSRDKKRFPWFDDALRKAMYDETVLFFNEIIRKDLSVVTLLDADFTFVNGPLAKHYGIEGVEGPEMRRVELKDRRRGGVLTMASVLTCNSNQTRTSPVLRGKWVLEVLLNTPPPPPEPNVGEPPEKDKEGKPLSLRKSMELHRSKPKCMGCHVKMDPIGFGFENYDATGRWRDKIGSEEIDVSAELPDGSRFNGPVEFKDLILKDRTAIVRTMIEKILTYALGRGVEFYDAAALRGMFAALKAARYRFSVLVTEVVLSYPFRYRRNKSAAPQRR